eukprot:scaffold1697_cov180-Amphora_coffeaeformis.AAC.26
MLSKRITFLFHFFTGAFLRCFGPHPFPVLQYNSNSLTTNFTSKDDNNTTTTTTTTTTVKMEEKYAPFLKGGRHSKLDPELLDITEVESDDESDDAEFGIKIVVTSQTTRPSKRVNPLLIQCVVLVSLVFVFATIFDHISTYPTAVQKSAGVTVWRDHSGTSAAQWGEEEEHMGKIDDKDDQQFAIAILVEDDDSTDNLNDNEDEDVDKQFAIAMLEEDDDSANDVNDTEDDESTDDDSEEEEELSLEERKKFSSGPWDYDFEAFQKPKPTPSGWWPDDLWIHDCVNKERDLKPFINPPEWNDYVLGDCVKLCGRCPRDDYHSELAHEVTIAGQYYDLACDEAGPQWHMKRGNETLLNSIIDGMHDREGFEIPDPDELVIHLRLGDKMEDSEASVFEMLEKSADPGRKSFNNVHGIKSLYEFMTNVVTSGATKIEIRGGSQHPDMYKKSKTYAYCLKEAFEEAGYDTKMNLEEGDADIDFYYMVNARKMIPTLGGFSRFIGHLVLQRGGIVYGRIL